MSTKPVPLKQLQSTINAIQKFPSLNEAATRMGVARATLQGRIAQAKIAYKAKGLKFPKLFTQHAHSGRVNKLVEDAKRLKTQGSDTVSLLKEDNEQLRHELGEVTSSLRETLERASADERLVKTFAAALKNRPYRPQMPKPNLKGSRNKADAHEMMVVVSDAHFPEVVEPAAAFGLNYNGHIALKRLAHLRDTVIRYRDLRSSAYPVRKLTIAVLGDMLSGNIHEELEVSNEFPMSTAVIEMSSALHEVALSLAEHFPEVEMVVMPGNHPRLHQKPRYKQKYDNWEYVMGHSIKMLAQKAYTVTVPKDLVYRHKIFDFNVGLTHGDGIKAPSAFGMPWYSMKRKQDALQSLLKSLNLQQLDLLCYGHFHQLIFQEGQGCSLLVNGSIKGGDEFSLGTGYSSQTPVQALVTFHPRHGITDVSRINLGHISE